MNSSEREIRQGVLEFGIIPKLLPMAGATIRECSVVDIILLMAGGARLTQARQTSTILMTLRTLKTIVNSGERKILMKV
jgi:hypothetical protein